MEFRFEIDAIIDPNVPGIFYPFGTDEGDSVAPVNDDGSTASIPISTGFPFFNSTNVNLFVNTNGAISFRRPVGTYTPNPFPVPDIFVAAYWCDIDTTRNGGRIYYRQSTDSALLKRATDDILPTYGPRGLGFFKAKWVFVTTWYKVTFYGGSTGTPVNTFQAILVTDGKYSFTIFNYGIMKWTTGTASGGDSNGLGGTPAQVGFNAGDSINYFAVPGSRTDSIINIGKESNIEIIGRWLFRIDAATIEMPGCESNDPCRAYQTMNPVTKACSDTAPSFECPTIDGPNENQFHVLEFYCNIPTTVTDSRALFQITFLFDGKADATFPPFVTNAAIHRATLHEMYLAGKMGKWISCSARSYWNYAAQDKSRSLTSINSFWAGVKTTADIVTVEEKSQTLPTVLLQSALPVVCTPANNGQGKECELRFQLATVDDKGVLLNRQNMVPCSYLIKGSDWKPDEKLAYDVNASLKFAARQDPFQTAARFSMLSLSIGQLPHRTAGGQTFPNIWSGYALPSIWVYRYDEGGASCSSTGDPNVRTFDSLYYSIYNAGQFIYSQSRFGVPFEVHVRHNHCTSNRLACVCGVAMREKDLILAADMCGAERRMHYLTFNSHDLPDGAGITTSSAGNSFKIQLPSGNKVVVYVNGWGMTIQVYIMGSDKGRTEGLCGSYDNNQNNDLTVKGTNNYYPVSGGQAPAVVLSSWQIPAGQSLFDGHLADLPVSEFTDLQGSFCSCNSGAGPKCDVGLHDVSSAMWEPNQDINPNVPANVVFRQRQRLRKRSVRDNNNNIINDNIDYDYDSGSFNFTNPITENDVKWNFTWPTWNGITYEQAYQHCYFVLWANSTIQRDCSSYLSDNGIKGIVDKCVNDVKATGDLGWADDKIPEMQLYCINEIVSKRSDNNDTVAAIEDALAVVQDLQQFICFPSNCNGHGTCMNGTCVCQSGYVGTGCSVLASAVPSIVRVLDLDLCDVRQRRCQSLQMITDNMSDLPSPTCKIQITKMGKPNVETFLTRAAVTSLTTSTCALPLEALISFSNNINFTDAALQAGAKNFSLIAPGNPVLKYRVSISNDGNSFSDAVEITVMDSLCYTRTDGGYSRVKNTCFINGYCFADGDTNPYRRCDLCKTSVSEINWSTIWGIPCYLDPCKSSPCPENTTCVFLSETDYECSENTTITPGRCLDQDNRNGFVCDNKNPCTVDNLNHGCYVFPCSDPTKYIQCDGINRCSFVPCDPGYVWSINDDKCVLQ